jgi:hypothetical protein
MFGGVSCKKECIKQLLQTNKKVFITPGGSREINYSNRFYLDLNLKNEGFIKLAWEQKALLVPLFSEGENRVFNQIKIPFIQNKCYQLLRYHFPTIFLGPYSTNLTLHIGTPLDPIKFDSFDSFRENYWKSLFKLIFEHEKGPIKGELYDKMTRLGFKIDNKKREKMNL